MSTTTVRDRLLAAVMSNHGIFALNAFLLILSATALWVMIPMLFDSVNNAEHLENISEYFGVILIGYGVAVEERSSFIEIFRPPPASAPRSTSTSITSATNSGSATCSLAS